MRHFTTSTMRLALSGLMLIVPMLASAQDPIIIDNYVCVNEGYREYIYETIKARESDDYCDEGTELRGEVFGDTHIASSVTVTRLDGGPHRAQVNVNWVPGATGILEVKVSYKRREHRSGNFDCEWEPWSYMYTYRFHKYSINPGAQITGVTEIVAADPHVIFNLEYLPAETYPWGRADKVRYWDGTQYVQTSIRKVAGLFYLPTTLLYTASGFGEHNLQLQVYDECDEWHTITLPPLKVTPSCHWDGASQIFRIEGPDIVEHSDGSFEVKPNTNYTLYASGFTDFGNHYNFNHDGAQDIVQNGNSFTITKALGSYNYFISLKPGRDCPAPSKNIQLVLGGRNLTLEQLCPIVFPDDFGKFGYVIDPNDIVLEHFAATVKSERSITVKPGVTLNFGAELILERPVAPVDSDLDKNFVEQVSYDEYGRVVSSSRQYFDDKGQPTQAQQKNLAGEVILASAVMYDAYGRQVISTLPAPVQASDDEDGRDECGEVIDPNDKLDFLFKSTFVKASNVSSYSYINFDLTKETSPDPVDGSQEGTLGWYYSANNGSSANPRMNEPLVAITQYPYSRTLFHHDGSGEVKGVTRPGDNFRAGSGNVGSVVNESVQSDDPYLVDYLAIRRTKLGLANLTVEGEFFRAVAIDETAKKSVTYTDRAGHSIMSLYFGTQQHPVTKSYQFFDNAGRLKISISPNGVSQYEAGAGFESIDKTAYFYNGKGLLSAIEETDGGRTEYVYRKDGKIRFSQNAKQRKAEDNGGVVSYSYTNYDRSGRPVESGEYVPGTSGIAFKSMEMTAILENVTVEGGLSEASGQKRSRLNTLYDEPDPLLPGGRIQRFVQGTVSRTKKDNDITTWYSYDERARVEWMVQDIGGFGTKTIDYRYGPTGQVQEVLYQKAVAGERFSHFYEYDADGRLFKAYTTTSELQYNKKGELLNASERKLQATYHYYLHGPLKRIELADKLQGIDYVYTADGALKSINSADPNAGTDPGKDGVGTSAFRKDVFGMTLDYFNQDYTSAGNTLPNVPLPATYPEQHGGLIRAMRWHSPIETGKQFAYGYTYDNRDQFKTASWGTVTANVFATNPLSAYNESISGYDPNGNIDELNRKNSIGANIANFDYKYIGNSNKLDRIEDLGDHSVVRDYDYNAIGELTTEIVGDKQKHIEYDVTGKVTKVFSDAAKTRLVTTFVYDDRGFRLNKTTYNEEGSAVSRTWYVRDASGTAMATYEDDLSKPEPAEITELPVYASGRVGLFKPKFNYTQYELTDHLGNVRAVIGKPMEAEYLATMESERLSKESSEQQGDFDNIDNDITATDFNHTPPSVTVNGVSETISEPNEVNRLNTMPISGQPTSPIGTGIMLWVHPGDVIDAEVFVKYANFNAADNNIVESLAGFLTTAFGASPVVDAPSLFSVVDEPGFVSLPAWSKLNEDQPRAFLNYLLFDNDFKLQAFDFDQVSSEAEIQGAPRPHERLALEEITIKKEGYLYIYVSNQSAQNMEVYFDDLRVKHTYSDIEAGADFYPFGLTIEDRQIRRESYRHGYQGKFAEKDEETGWNHFELRQYDPVIGRWTILDPKRAGFSPYNGMNNDPINKTDPDGGCPGGCPPRFSFLSKQASLVNSFRPTKTPRINLTVGVGFGARGRLGAFDNVKLDYGADPAHALFSYGTNGSSLQVTVVGGAFKPMEYDQTLVGAEGYFFRANLSNKGNEYDYWGRKRGLYSNITSEGYIDNDPANIVDLGVAEVGFESNYDLGDFKQLLVDWIEGVRDYVRSQIHIVE